MQNIPFAQASASLVQILNQLEVEQYSEPHSQDNNTSSLVVPA